MSETALKPKSILVLGTNAGQADLIRHMKSLNWIVHSCAHRAGGPGEALSDEFHLVNVLDIEAVAELARKLDVDVVYSISSDIAMTSAVAVSELLDMPHFFSNRLVDLFNQKPAMRKFLNENDLGVVAYQKLESIEDLNDWNTFPCMVKPSDSQGQRGVQRVNSAEELEESVQAALDVNSQSGTAIIEAFLDGVEISCNVLVKDSRLIFDVLSERLAYDGALTGVPKGHLVPCVNVTEAQAKEAINLVHRTVEALKITDGCLYFQMKVTSHGVRIIEIAPRLDGCHMWRLIYHATGEDFLRSTVETLLDDVPDIKSRPEPGSGEYYELMFQQEKPGHKFVSAAHKVPSDALYHEYRYVDGETILPINGKMENVGYYVRKMSDIDVEAHKI